MTAAATETRSDVPPVEVEHISVRFGAIQALSDVSFTVAPGTIHAVSYTHLTLPTKRIV